MGLDYNVIVTGLVAPLLLLLLRFLLDLSLAQFFVKYFWWLPVRSLFRDNPISLGGVWEQQWGSAGSEDFSLEIDRHSYTTIRQLGRYCYAEFYSKGVEYSLFGSIRGGYVIGTWYDRRDKYSYFGTFQFKIVDSRALKGLFLGHSKKSSEVQQDVWEWKR